MFADDNLILSKSIWFAIEKEENIVGKVENAFYHHVLIFPQFLIGRREPDNKRDHKFWKPICWGQIDITATCDSFYLQSYNTNTTCCDLITLNF